MDPRRLPHATTTRHCPGLGPRAPSSSPFGPEARAALAPAGLELGRAAWARQVHGAEVARVGARGGFAGTADVLVTTERGVPLAIFTADCLGLLAWDPEAGVLALAHAGWRGLVRGVPEALVTAARAVGARAERLLVAVSPSIGPCCYEVDGPVADAFRAVDGASWERWARATRPGHWMLDLWTATADLLGRAGVAATRIANPRLCTACHPELLYSHRKGHHGRLATVAALP